jgi:hypothetical protein
MKRVKTEIRTAVKAVALLMALLLAAISFVSCGNRLKFKASSDAFENNRTGVKYHYVLEPYIPKAVSKEAYTTWVMSRGVKVDFFPIQGLDPEEWLYSEVGDLICSLDVSLPDLYGFAPSRFYLCYNSEVTASFAVSDDTDVIVAVLAAYRDGQVREYNFNEFNSYVVLFESDAYPEFYYKLSLLVTPEALYLGSRLTGVVDVTGLFGELVPEYVEEYHD